jgi:hypothetical protein
MHRPRSRLADSAVLSDGSFMLAPPLLQTFARGALADGATDKAGNISRHDLSFIPDTTAATISGRPAHDTGASGSHGLTNEPKPVGTATDANGIAKFSGALDRGASPVTLTPALLNTLAGGALHDGAHTPHFVATDTAGKTSSLDLSFMLDTKIASASFDLAPASESGRKGDHATTVVPAALRGSPDPNAQVTPGLGNFTTQATSAAGNQVSSALTMTAADPPSISAAIAPIVKNFVTDFGAVADGMTDDSPALDRWLAWAQAQGTAPVELYMPPGHYHFAGDNGLTAGLYNVTISGYGATVDSLYIGTPNLLLDDFDHSARIQTVSAGATSVDLITPADASKFSVGQWVLVSGLELQGGAGGNPGYPPNFQFFEYKQIVNISGSVVTFASPLVNSYESTWPVVDSFQGGTVNLGGPATIYALGPAFGAQQTILGLEVTANANNNNGAVFMSAGLSLVLDGMKFDGQGPDPSLGQSVVIRNSYFGTMNEIDKVLSYLEYDNDTGQQLLVQSAAPTTLVINGSTFSILNGTAQNTSIANSTIGVVKAGPLFFGGGESLSIINSSIAGTALEADLHIDPSQVSFNNGTFRVATASRNVASVYAWAVPGHEYFFAYYDGSIHATDDTGHITSFKVLDVRQDATYTYVDTDLGATLPTPTFIGGQPANQYIAYPVMTVAQTNSGPADFVSLAPAAPPTGAAPTFDHWINSAGGDWATAANWGKGVPTANLAADIDASGTYTVTISSAGTTYGLLITAAGATVSDNTGGSLVITDSGGPSNPNGALTISAGSFALAGGGLTAGSISIANGGNLLVSQSYTGTRALAESITNNGSITISNASIVTFNGAISGSGSVTVQNRAQAIFNTAITGTGSFTLQDRGSLEFGAADSENVTFAAGARGTLKIDHSLTAPFTGYLSGLSTKNSVDLVDLAWTRWSMTATYSGTTSGGTLTVSNGTNSVKLNLLGDYSTASWLLSKDRNGGTLVVDPPISGSLTPDADHGTASGIDLSEISFGANTTLAYAANNDNTGGTLTVSDGLHAQSLALLGQYMASSFSMASDGHGGTLITDPALTQQSQLTLPHA